VLVLLPEVLPKFEQTVLSEVVACELGRGESAVLHKIVGMATYLNATLLCGIGYTAFAFAGVWYDFAGEELRLVVETVVWLPRGDAQGLSCSFGSSGHRCARVCGETVGC
jgi:hypothetical protein